jgi:cytochrome c-type biogenesis protein
MGTVDFGQVSILVALMLAFGAGVLSFASPCVLPLVPAYVGHLAGRTLDKESASRAHTLAHALVFVLGFTAVFVVLGASASLLGALAQGIFRSLAFRIVAGAVLVVMGLHMMGLLRINALYRDTRFQLRPNRRLGYLSSFVVGVIFAAGWTPCIGPILGAILIYAGMQSTILQGVLLLTAYSLGLGVPFLLAGYALEHATRVVRRLNRHAHAVELTSGALMIGMGVLVMLNVMSWIASWAYQIGYTGV